MKKVYLSLVVLAFSSVSFGQTKIAKTNLRAKSKINVSDNNDSKTRLTPSATNKVVFWQNTFSNPADWTLTNNSVPAVDWQITTDATGGGATWFSADFASTSVADGFALIDSDAIGDGTTQDARIVNAVPIDCSAHPAVLLSFEQFHARYLETTTVSVSGDNGSTWTDYVINDGVAVNGETANPELIQLNISQVAGGQAQVLIAFSYLGAWDYGWAIDDVQLQDALGNELVISKTFSNDVVNAWDYSIIATNQVQPLTVGAIVYNLGGTAANGISVNVKINDGTSNVYDQNSTLDLAIGVTDTMWVATGFTPAANKNYTVTFTLPADDNLTNNVSTPATFSTNDNVYAHDFDGTAIFRFNRDDETAMGNQFEIVVADELHGIDIEFATGTTATQAIVRLSRYNPNDAVFNSVQAMEYVDEVNGGQFAIAAGMINNGITTAYFSSPIQLEATWIYVAEVRKAQGIDRIFLGGSNDGDDDLSTVGFGPFGTGGGVNYFIGWGFAPAVRLNFAPQASISEVENVSAFSVYPNPAKENVTISFDLKNETAAKVQITDLAGKEVYASNLGNKAGKNSVSVNTNTFANGIYVVNFITNNGVVTEKLVINK